MHENVQSPAALPRLLQLFEADNWTTDTVLVKTLTKNDDSGRHGVLIPREAYPLFPALGGEVESGEHNPWKPITTSWDTGAGWTAKPSKFIHYNRYPERRITSLEPSLLNRDGPRIFVVAKRRGSFEYRCLLEQPGSASWALALELLGAAGLPEEGMFRLLSSSADDVDSPTFDELLGKLREIAAMGWVQTARAGDTGVGMTLEHLLGIRPNSNTDPDWNGIELKAKRVRGKSGGRRTLFAKTPEWGPGGRGALLDEHGSLDGKGRFSIYQSIYAHRESKEGWQLEYDDQAERLWVRRRGVRIVSWQRSTLANSLEKKHRETAFVSAESRGKGVAEEFHFTAVMHARGADIDRYIAALLDGGGCHDFAMHRTERGTVRDHGFLFRIDDSDVASVFRDVRLYPLEATSS